MQIVNAMERRFVVPGRAVSFRSPRAAAYKAKVRKAAAGVFLKNPPTTAFDVFVDYFHNQPRRMDMDNVAKCVLDALNNIAYVDDRQVRRQSAHAYDLAERFTLHRGPADLIKPLAMHDEYVVVRVREAVGDAPPRRRRRRR